MRREGKTGIRLILGGDVSELKMECRDRDREREREREREENERERDKGRKESVDSPTGQERSR
jgi:hypothetical protein